MVASHYRGFCQTDYQKSLLDSLEYYSQQDTSYVKNLNSLAMSYWNSAPNTTDSLARIALSLSKTSGYIVGICNSYYSLAIGQWMLGNYPLAFEYASQELKLAEEKELEAKIYSAYSIMALVSDDQGLVDQALAYHRKVLAYRKRSSGPDRIASTLNNMASVYWQMDSLDKSLELFQEAYALRKKEGSKRNICESLANISYILSEKGELAEALKLSKEALSIAEEIQALSSIANIKSTLGKIYLTLNQSDSAEQILLEGLQTAEQVGIGKRIIEIQGLLAETYEKKKAFEEAYQALNAHWKLKDSLEGIKASKQVAGLQAQYENEKQERAIIELQQENQISQYWRNVFALSAMVAFLSVVLVFTLYRIRQKRNQLLLKEKEIQARQLTEVNQMKSRFLANISHEFRTPLTLILNPTEHLLASSPEGPEKQQLTWIYRNGQRLLKLINQLLELSKIEENKLQIKASPYDLVSYCKYMTSGFESLASQKHIHLVFSPVPEKLFVYFDPEKLEQVIMNLLSNAFKFTEEGLIQVKIEEETREGKNYAKITISDSGIGIFPQQLPYIFDRFYQAEQLEEKALHGTGIGLTLSKELVELHSGIIEVDSKVGKGTQFYIYLPMGSAHLSKEEIVPTLNYIKANGHPAESLGNDPVPLKQAESEGPLVLIVDDNADLLELIQLQLSNSYRFLTAGNGKEGWEMALKELPDLIVSDVMMPVMGGFELCEKIKQDLRTDHIPIILLTARVGQELKLKGLQMQADDYLQKPFNYKELEVRIQNLIKGRKLLQKRFSEGIRLEINEGAVSSQQERFLNLLTEIVEEHLSDIQFDVSALCQRMGMSKSQLNRKMKAVLSKSPNQFIRSYRLEKARQKILQQPKLTLAEIAYDVGFSSPAYFSKCFHDEFGMAPSELSKRAI